MLNQTKQMAVLYAGKLMAGLTICWFGLSLLGLEQPFWALITLVVVSDADPKQAFSNTLVRTINTIVGCVAGLLGMYFVGSTVSTLLIVVPVVTITVIACERYPANWKLAPITVIVLFSAVHMGASHSKELHFAVLRCMEVIGGAAVEICLTWVLLRAGVQLKRPRAVV